MKIAFVYGYYDKSGDKKSIVDPFTQKNIQELIQKAGIPEPDHFALLPQVIKRELSHELWTGKPYKSPLQPYHIITIKDRLELLKKYDAILTIGRFALWCLTGEDKLTDWRGTHMTAPLLPGVRVIPTIEHQVFTYTDWAERPRVMADITKVTRPLTKIIRRIYIPESPADVDLFIKNHIKDEIAFDVETVKTRMTEFSITASPQACLYVKLEDKKNPTDRNVWTKDDELAIMMSLHKLCMRKDLVWIMHNATYDLSYMDLHGLHPLGEVHDTMLMHHALEPEWPKALRDVAALRLNTEAWKHLRTKKAADTNDAGDE